MSTQNRTWRQTTKTGNDAMQLVDFVTTWYPEDLIIGTPKKKSEVDWSIKLFASPTTPPPLRHRLHSTSSSEMEHNSPSEQDRQEAKRFSNFGNKTDENQNLYTRRDLNTCKPVVGNELPTLNNSEFVELIRRNSLMLAELENTSREVFLESCLDNNYCGKKETRLNQTNYQSSPIICRTISPSNRNSSSCAVRNQETSKPPHERQINASNLSNSSRGKANHNNGPEIDGKGIKWITSAFEISSGIEIGKTIMQNRISHATHKSCRLHANDAQRD